MWGKAKNVHLSRSFWREFDLQFLNRLVAAFSAEPVGWHHLIDHLCPANKHQQTSRGCRAMKPLWPEFFPVALWGVWTLQRFPIGLGHACSLPWEHFDASQYAWWHYIYWIYCASICMHQKLRSIHSTPHVQVQHTKTNNRNRASKHDATKWQSVQC